MNYPFLRDFSSNLYRLFILISLNFFWILKHIYVSAIQISDSKDNFLFVFYSLKQLPNEKNEITTLAS